MVSPWIVLVGALACFSPAVRALSLHVATHLPPESVSGRFSRMRGYRPDPTYNSEDNRSRKTWSGGPSTEAPNGENFLE
ncbi:hypothetical protein PCANC_25079 [Puccinia coronata f. sp. avenae]|uniref:Secreted protein n=1 Tax=Puccinia coronata f. sp. avenae TaxID=200324 RepID=A0A2N5TMN7_9BASI|nr:hypothetical protein PCANC_25079 [Puccinia coronata f. sp. avenae]PLW26708.1 hypothetical protein PCASD_20760 [Puccinia coronata f. sp. avenae]PLW26769.1 hypothetical protein PCASD_24342 [Puccinia coronata f. sp. avenae]PLW28624.1 hypothetical protein PCASD_21185 [Puccinia coronata f. sp. avenae]PLW29885.1 hypothetical protein PCASD_16601 [Puccinia coronata f. sp. avenae]